MAVLVVIGCFLEEMTKGSPEDEQELDKEGVCGGVMVVKILLQDGTACTETLHYLGVWGLTSLNYAG